jgi:hypothetical protein
LVRAVARIYCEEAWPTAMTLTESKTITLYVCLISKTTWDWHDPWGKECGVAALRSQDILTDTASALGVIFKTHVIVVAHTVFSCNLTEIRLNLGVGVQTSTSIGRTKTVVERGTPTVLPSPVYRWALILLIELEVGGCI